MKKLSVFFSANDFEDHGEALQTLSKKFSSDEIT